MKRKSRPLRCLYAASESCADLLYLGGVFVPDPFLAVLRGGCSTAVVNRLEFSRVARHSRFDEVLLLETVREEAAAVLGLPAGRIGPAGMIRFFAKQAGVQAVEVPPAFPAGITLELQAAGLGVSVGRDPFFPERLRKSDAEARFIRRGNAASAAGIRTAERILRSTTIRGNKLYFEGRVLTSERLRARIDQACLERGASAAHTIVAGGRQACDPHVTGHGPLRAGELIIVDVFPRVLETGYHGDLTRTFLRGKASPAQRALVAAVRAAQKAAAATVRAGVSGATVHRAAEKVFAARGYATGKGEDGVFSGFIHSTGHGLGLEVHEPPRLAPGAGRLRDGEVVTIEPGLYYPGLGACRIEDVVRVMASGCEKLSSLHYRWEL